MTIFAFGSWLTNAELIADAAALGYLRKDWMTLDPTFGEGTFWNVWRPDYLVASDIDPEKSPLGNSVDFTRLPWGDEAFDATVFDPPFKLNGTPDPTIDERYGVHLPTRWQDRMALVRAGLTECCRVTSKNVLLKCQDQVCSGKIRWQTYEFTKLAESLGFGLVDRFDFPSYRPQPDGRRQVHARRNTSTLLVFKRGWESTDLR